MLDPAARAADLLVVGDDGPGRLVVDDEPEVRLVVAHPQRARRHDRLDVVGQQPLLDRDPALRVDLAAVRLGGDPPGHEPLGDELGVALRERVDDPGPLELRQPRREPREPVGLGGQLDHLEPQARAAQRPAVGPQRRGVGARAQLLLDVGDDAVVRGRRRPEHRDARRQQREHLGQPPVVGPEVVAPVRDAVRLVDHDETDPRREQRQHPVAELRVVEPLGTDQQQVDRVLREQRLDLGPRVAVGRVDRVRADPEPLGRGDLVAHQRQQRRDDQRGPGALLAQQRGRDEVDGRLAPARPLHAQHARVIPDQVVDRLELAGTERGARPGERVQELGGPVLDGDAHHVHPRTRSGGFAPRPSKLRPWSGPGAASPSCACGAARSV